MLNNLIFIKANEWIASDTCTVKPLFEHIKRNGNLREAQIQALLVYLFLKIEAGNKPLSTLFSENFFGQDEDLSHLNINQNVRNILESNHTAKALFDLSRTPIKSNGNGKKAGTKLFPELEQYIIKNPDKIDYEAVSKNLFYGVEYPDYLFSLPMGAGKTFLMAAFIYLDLYFAINEPDNPIFSHNFLILAPSGLKSSIIPSLRTIERFDPSWILPEPAASNIKRMIKFEILDQPKSAKKSNKARNPNAQKISGYQPFDTLMGLVMVVNAEKVILDRIPTPKDIRVKKVSAQWMSYKLLKYVTENLSPSDKGKIPESWYSEEGRLSEVDKDTPRIKDALVITLNDGVLRKELPFLRKYSSVQIKQIIRQTAVCTLKLNYPIRFFNGKDYQTIPFNNYVLPSRLFTGIIIKSTKLSKDNHILEREYVIQLNTILGYMFMQNAASCYMDLLPGKFYEMSDYAQLFYRVFILTYFPNKKSGKTPKNPVSLEEIRTRLVLKTPDSYMVRKIISRILKELEDYKFISVPKEEKIYGAYMYSYKKNTWKEITGEEETPETDLDFIEN